MLKSSPESNWLTESQASRITQILQELVESIAPAILRDSLEGCTSLSQLLSKIKDQLPEAAKPQFCQQTSWLVEKAIDDPAFVSRCEQALNLYIGVLAPLLTVTLLQQHPEMTKHDFVDVLATYLKHSAQAHAFRQALII